MGVKGLRSVGAMVVPGLTTRTIGPLNTVVVGAITGALGIVVTTGGTGVTGTVVVVVVFGTTVVTGPVAVRGNLPDTNSAMQSRPGRYKRIGLRVGFGGASQSTLGRSL